MVTKVSETPDHIHHDQAERMMEEMRLRENPELMKKAKAKGHESHNVYQRIIRHDKKAAEPPNLPTIPHISVAKTPSRHVN
jgi:succinate dehydrogenase/fumarate reductase flavoprotein subunit